MAWTQAQYDSLEAAIGSGVLSVTYDGPPRRSVTYQNVTEMRTVLAEMRAQLNSAPTHRYAQTSKGFSGSSGGTSSASCGCGSCWRCS